MLYEITIPPFVKGLHNLSTYFDKGAAYADIKKFDMGILLNARLVPDQFHFIKQIQIACDTAKLCASRLTGKDAPAHADQEKTLNDLKSRVDSTISYLESFSPADFADAADRRITTPRWDGQFLTGEEYVLHHALPNFYFHVTTAYAILRHNGVDLGKKDYLGKMPFKR